MTPTQEMKRKLEDIVNIHGYEEREEYDKSIDQLLALIEEAYKKGWQDEKASQQECKHNKTLEKGWRCVDCDYEKLFKPSKNRSKLDSTKKNSIKGIK